MYIQNITSNILPILLATILSFVVGYVWYGPLFGDKWMKLNGFNKEKLMKDMADQKGMMKMYGTTFLASLVMNIFIAMHMGNKGADIAIPASLLNSFALVGLGSLSHYLFERKSISHWLINAGYTIVMVVIAGACISLL